jgi:hypothetical protein
VSRRRRKGTAASTVKGLPNFGNVTGAIRDIGQQVAQLRDQITYGPGAATPLPRPPQWASAPFGPGSPLYPAPLDPVRPDSGRPAPRLYEYPVSWNLTGSSNRLTPWQLLRDAADGVSLFRRCIEIRKDHLGGLDWDIVIGQGAIEAAQRAEGPKVGRADLESKLRDRLSPEIDRAAAFLETPDRGNGYDFSQWLSMLLEESFVLDAVAIYPRRTYGGDLWSLEVLDGSTVKPLLDERGGRPMSPAPAYQQILYGFPRGEFTADTVRDETTGAELIPGAYPSDQLIYSRRVVRVWTPYGYSAVEQALDDGDLYLKRHGWMKREYTDGVSVSGLFKIDPASSTGMWSPEQVIQYERQYNDAIAGNSAARLMARFLPPGVEPADGGDNLTAMAEKYKPEYDLHLIKLLASHFDTTLPELGFTEAKGLGSEGYHEGQADVQHRKTRPIIKYVEALITTLMRKHASMPRELEFRFLGLDDEDEPGADDVEAKRQANGVRTLNERRDDLGQPRYDFVEADMPMIITPHGVIFLEGSSTLAPPGTEVEPPKLADPAQGGAADDEADDATAKPGAEDDNKAKAAELAAYRKWAAKGVGKTARRPFEFRHCTAEELAGLHPPGGIDFVVKTGAAGVGGVHPKAAAPTGRQWPGWSKDLAVVQYYAPRLQDALVRALRGPTSATALSHAWLSSRTAATDLGIADARAWLDAQGIDLETPLRRVLTAVWTEGYFIGDRAAAAMVAGLLLTRKDAADYVFDVRPDWGNWTPGDARAAALMLDAEGRSGGLIELLDAAGVDIMSIASHRFDDLARVLHRALAEGWSEGKLAKQLRGVLADPRYARLVASTELNRATSAASLGRYRDNNVEAKEWMDAGDVRVCKPCAENEGDGPIPLDAYFSSGDDAPPGTRTAGARSLRPGRRAAPWRRTAGSISSAPGSATLRRMAPASWPATSASSRRPTPRSEAAEEWLAEYDDEMGRLAEALASAVADSEDLSSGAFGTVTMVTTEDAGAYIRKVIKYEEEGLEAARQQDAEELAGMVARAFGLDGPAVYRAADNEVIMSWLSGVPAYALTDAIIEGALLGNDGQRMRLMDILISNRDRNGGNWLIAEDNLTIQPIDHGLAFQEWSAPGVPPPWRDDLLAGWASNGDWIENVLSQGDVIELKRRLSRLEDRFTDLGRHDWYDAMWQRLEVLAQHARGTERLIT